MAVKITSMRWWLLFLCLVLGTWFGVFMQDFGAFAPYFRNVVDFAVDIKQIDLIMLRLGFLFALKMNLGTLIGGIIGIWLAR